MSAVGMDRDEESALWQMFRNDGSPAARELLFTRHAPYARGIARRYHSTQSGREVELGEFFQLAYVGLLEAIDRFLPERGTPFRPFAARRIEGSISHGLRQMSEVREQLAWRRRVQRERMRSLAEGGEGSDALGKLTELAIGLALGFLLEDSGMLDTRGINETVRAQPNAYQSLAWKQTVARLQTALADLPERERNVLRAHYLEGVSFDELAKIFHVTNGRVSQVHHTALKRLRERMSEKSHFMVEQKGVP